MLSGYHGKESLFSKERINTSLDVYNSLLTLEGKHVIL